MHPAVICRATGRMPALGVCLAVAALACTSVSASGPTVGEAGTAADKIFESPILKHHDAAVSGPTLLAARLEAIGVHDADEMCAVLQGLGLRTLEDLALLDEDWAVAEL